MAIKPIDFFKEKRAWSMAKDQILGKYLVPYLCKLKSFNKLIVIVDGFAGCGLYKDGTEGSPSIICKTIENLKSKGVKAMAIFIDYDKDCFDELKENVKDFENKKIALPIRGDFRELTSEIIKTTKNCPTFFYIDPFGIKGLEFDNLKQIFQKVSLTSTEVLINFNYKALLREYKENPSLTDKVMDGDYYRTILENRNFSQQEKEDQTIRAYKEKYRRFFKYVGSCPIMHKDEQMAKYHLIFATSHLDGLKLMNNEMGNIYRKFHSDGRLFCTTPTGISLGNEIMDLLKTRPHKRAEIKGVLIEKHFLMFKESVYNQAVDKLLKRGKIRSDTGKIRINDNNSLFPNN